MSHYVVICEGPSEVAFLKQFNRMARENNLPLYLHPESSDGGYCSQVVKKYKKLYKNNKHSNFIIWVDNDIYKRNEHGNLNSYNKKPSGIPDFKFNYYNFEDIMTLFLSDELINRWQNICEKNHHFTTPMKSDIYLPLFKENILPDYDKGDYPFENLDIDMLKRAFLNNNSKKIKFHSDFFDHLELLVKQST